MSIDKQRTNKLLSKIDQMTIKSPVVFPDNQIDKRIYIEGTKLFKCIKCDDMHSEFGLAINQGPNQLCWNCYYSSPTVQAPEKGWVCAACDCNYIEGLSYDVPTIDGVEYPGKICSRCIYDCAEKLEHESVMSKIEINDDITDAMRFMLLALRPVDPSVPAIFRGSYSFENWTMPVNIDNNIYQLWVF